MTRQRKTPEQKIAGLKEQQQQLAARIKNEEAKIKKAERKKDTRRKIIAGAIALEHVLHDEQFGGRFGQLLNRYVTKPEERALFDLPVEQGAHGENSDRKVS